MDNSRNTIPDGSILKNDYTHDAPMFVQQQRIETITLIQLVKHTTPLGGAMAEVGVCEGGSAWFIREADTERDFHLFDTFDGLPDGSLTNRNAANFMAKPFEVVKETFKDRPKMFFHKGVFPQMTGRYIEDLRFSFVHIDVDVYRSVLDCLGFFYYRMLPEGIIIVHDYEFEPSYGKQVKAAVDLFFKDKPEQLHKFYTKKTYSTQVCMIKEKAELPNVLPSKDDPDKVDKLIDYLKRVREEGCY